MSKLNECQDRGERAQTVHTRSGFRRLSCVLAIAGIAALVLRCGGSAPEAQSPASVAPSAPAEAPAPADAQSEAAAQDEGVGTDGFGGPTPGMQPAPPPAQAPVLEEAKPSAQKKRKESSSETDDLAEPGFAQRHSLPQALAAIERFDAQLSAAIELSAPDCDQAEGFRRAVCQLAERICVLENDLPSSGAERHCGDSRARCTAATSRFRQTCSP